MDRASGKSCPFVSGKADPKDINYMNTKFLRKFLTNAGKIVPSRITRVSRFYQNKIAGEVKLARYLGFLPYCDRH